MCFHDWGTGGAGYVVPFSRKIILYADFLLELGRLLFWYLAGYTDCNYSCLFVVQLIVEVLIGTVFHLV